MNGRASVLVVIEREFWRSVVNPADDLPCNREAKAQPEEKPAE